MFFYRTSEDETKKTIWHHRVSMSQVFGVFRHCRIGNRKILQIGCIPVI